MSLGLILVIILIIFLLGGFSGRFGGYGYGYGHGGIGIIGIILIVLVVLLLMGRISSDHRWGGWGRRIELDSRDQARRLPAHGQARPAGIRLLTRGDQ